jgi:hypothetical protein
MKKVIISTIFATLIAFTTVAQAQEGEQSPLPKEKVGLGVKVDRQNIGGSFAYALQPNVHIGAGLGLSFITGYKPEQGPEIDGGIQLMLNPFFRYIFQNVGNMFPYAEVNFSFSEIPSAANVAAITTGAQGSASKSYANVELGGMWFPFPSVSIRGGVNVINFDIDTSQLGIGIGYPFIGIDWWM